jgi:hypothetical protein
VYDHGLEHPTMVDGHRDLAINDPYASPDQGAHAFGAVDALSESHEFLSLYLP